MIIWTVAALVRPDETLCFKHMLRGPFAGAFNFPGGKRRTGENPIVTTIREVSEEVGVFLRADQLNDVGVIYSVDETGTIVGRCHIHLAHVPMDTLLYGDESDEALWTSIYKMQDKLTHTDDPRWMRLVLEGEFVVVFRVSDTCMRIFSHSRRNCDQRPPLLIK